MSARAWGRPAVWTAATALVLVALAVATVLSIVVPPFYLDSKPLGTPLQWITLGLWAGFVLALVLVRRAPRRAAIVLVLGGSVLLGGAAMAGPPNTSTDSARYAWDGIVQDAGISPYRYVPTSPALADLRPTWLFPAPVAGDDGVLRCPGDRILRFVEPTTGEIVCTAINRANDPTIYPPTAELVYAGVRLVVGPDAQYWPMQLVGLLASVAISVMLVVALVRRGRDPRWAALWAWCPLVATEAITNSHIDIVGSLLLLVATLLASRGRAVSGGIALGAAIATKLIPVIGAPALLGSRRRWWVAAGAVGVFVLLYLPYVIADGLKVIGFLPGYLDQEGFQSGGRSILLSAVLPGVGATVGAAAVIALVAVIVWRRTDPADPWLGQVVIIGVTLLAISPRYAWYALLIVPMIAMTGRWEWMLVPLALTERLLYADIPTGRVVLLVCALAIAIISIRRAGPGRFLALLRRPRALAGALFGARTNSD